MDPKENLLRAIHYDNPAYIPYPEENIRQRVSFDGHFRKDDWTDAWGVGWRITLKEFVPFPKVNPLPDLDRLSGYSFPDPNDLTISEEMAHTLNRPDRDQLLLFGQLYYLVYERAWALMGMENFMVGLYTHPKEMRALIDRIADYNARVFERYLELGVDGIGFSEDLGSQKALMMSPELFREFILPAYEKSFAPVLAAGKIVNFHSCGCVQSIVQDLASIGVDILNPVQARANDLHEVKATAAEGGMALLGGVDSHLLVVGTPDQVRRETLRVMRVLGPGGGYLAGPDQGMPWPAENYEAMVDTIRTYGQYPLRLPETI